VLSGGGLEAQGRACGPVGAQTRLAAELGGGFALLRASTREELVAMIREFLELAGDGACEIIELMKPPAA
jgi:hypothetical protein